MRPNQLVPISIADLERNASTTLALNALDYYRSGANDMQTLKDNHVIEFASWLTNAPDGGDKELGSDSAVIVVINDAEGHYQPFVDTGHAVPFEAA